ARGGRTLRPFLAAGAGCACAAGGPGRDFRGRARHDPAGRAGGRPRAVTRTTRRTPRADTERCVRRPRNGARSGKAPAWQRRSLIPRQEGAVKFLVVDDSATMRRIVVNSLHRLGYDSIVEAGDGREALDRYDSSVRFVITDWMMPNMSGTELARALRARSGGRDVPVLMVTARGTRDDIMSALEAGVSRYVVKPFTPRTLKEKIDLLSGGPVAE